MESTLKLGLLALVIAVVCVELGTATHGIPISGATVLVACAVAAVSIFGFVRWRRRRDPKIARKLLPRRRALPPPPGEP